MKTVLELEDLAARAVKAALAQQWQEAEDLNQQILDEDASNIEATNRLARAYTEQGQVDKAKQTYQRVLSLDPYNAIAQKNLTKLEQGGGQSARQVSQEAFLEEPGKTRSAPLVGSQKKRLEQLSSGEKLDLEARHGRLAVITGQGALVGYLEDDLSTHLLNLIHLGNTYSAHLMSTSDTPQVFLREVSQSPQAAKYVSFSRSHSLPSPASVKSGLNDDVFETTSDETDAWDNDGLNDESADADSDDEFNSMSLESMRDEEENDYDSSSRSRGDY